MQYGGLSVDYCECNPDFTVDDAATEINVKSATKQFVEIICSEVGHNVTHFYMLCVAIILASI